MQRRKPMRRSNFKRGGGPKKMKTVEQWKKQFRLRRMGRSRGSRLTGQGIPPSRADKWWRLVRSLGSVISGRPTEEVHHCAGRTGAHDKVHIGSWWLLPLTREEHQGPDGIHADPNRKAREKELFERVLVLAERKDPEAFAACAPPEDALEAIRSYHR